LTVGSEADGCIVRVKQYKRSAKKN